MDLSIWLGQIFKLWVLLMGSLKFARSCDNALSYLEEFPIIGYIQVPSDFTHSSKILISFMFRMPFGCCASNFFLESCAASASARSDFSSIDSWTTRKELQNHQVNKCTWSWSTCAKTSRDIQNYSWHTWQWWLGFKRTTCRICSTATSSLRSSNCKWHIRRASVYYRIKLHSKNNCTITE